MNHDRMRIRLWDKLNYYTPKRDLMAFALLNDAVVGSSLSDDEKQLRTKEQRGLLERRQAALFAWGLVQMLGLKSLEFAVNEGADYDAVFRWLDNDAVCYRPVQLKEVVSEYRNQAADLQSVLSSLTKYRDASDLTVAIYVNRRMTGDYTFEFPDGLTIGELFLFGACSPDGRRWFIQGDWMKQARINHVEYDYPLPGPEDFAQAPP